MRRRRLAAVLISLISECENQFIPGLFPMETWKIDESQNESIDKVKIFESFISVVQSYKLSNVMRNLNRVIPRFFNLCLLWNNSAFFPALFKAVLGLYLYEYSGN